MPEQPINLFDTFASPDWPVFFALFVGGLILDGLVGKRKVYDQLPATDEIFNTVALFLNRRLNRPHRSRKELVARGLIVCILFLPLLFFAGALANPFVGQNGITAGVTVFLLAKNLKQRQSWDNLFRAATAGSPDQPDQDGAARHRKAIINLTFAYADRGVVCLILFCIGGFALLLPYRFVRVWIDGIDATYPGATAGPFFMPGQTVAAALSFPGALLAALLLGLGALFVPEANPLAIRGLKIRIAGVPSLAAAPLGVMAYALSASLECPDGRDKSARVWLGPESGSARVSTNQVRYAGFIALTSWGLTLLATFFIAGYAISS